VHLRAAHNDAVIKRSDGIVVIDPERAKGQEQIVDACPYGAVYWNQALSLPHVNGVVKPRHFEARDFGGGRGLANSRG